MPENKIEPLKNFGGKQRKKSVPVYNNRIKAILNASISVDLLQKINQLSVNYKSRSHCVETLLRKAITEEKQ